MAFTFVLLYQAKLHPEIEPKIVANPRARLFATAQMGSSRAKLLCTVQGPCVWAPCGTVGVSSETLRVAYGVSD